MAEAIGIIASGISIGTLATGITSSIVKLKSYWDQVQDAPDDINDLIEELEILSHLLADIEDDQRQNPMSSLILDSTSTSRCLHYCKRGADRLKELTDNLSTDLDAFSKLKRKRASVKVVLKKSQIDRYKAKIERAIRLLSLSHQLYTRALLRVQPDIIVTKLSQTTVSGKGLLYEVLDPDHSSALRLDAAGSGTVTTPTATKMRCNQAWSISNLLGTFQYSRTRYSVVKRKQPGYRDRRREMEEVRAKYCGPSWLVNRVWEMQAVKSSLGWKFCPRTYNVVSNNSPVFILIKRNDVKGLQELFSKMEASPFDCNEYDSTPLFYAALRHSYDVCEFLIREGADPDYTASDHLTPLEIVLYDDMNYLKAVEGPRLLLNETEREPDLACYLGSKQGFSMWQQALDPLYYQRSLEERFEVAMSLTYGWKNGPEVLRLALARGALPSLAHCMTNRFGETLLHAVARGMGYRIHLRSTDLPRENYEMIATEWEIFVKELIVQGASLHSISSKYHTPFMALLKSCYFLEYFEPSVPKSINLASIGSSVSAFDDQESIEDPVIGIHRWSLWQYWKPSHVLYTWLKWLRESGVDLHEYGRKETDLHQQGLVRWNWRSFPSSRKRWFLTNLTYGPSPSDWKLDLEIRHEDASESVAKVPGEWIEDDFGEQTEDISVEKEEPHEHEE